MARIAILDDNVNQSYLKNARIKKRFLVVDHKVIRNQQTGVTDICTHGTVSAMILERCADDFELVNIQILKDFRMKDDISNLKLALKLCNELDIDMIHMSFGSSQLSDADEIKDIIRRLAVRGVIMVAAHHNRKKLSVPSAFDQVIGVQCDHNDILSPGQFTYLPNNPYGACVMINCQYPEFESDIEGFVPCNSYSVPVFVAYINKLFNRGIRNIPDIMEQISRDSDDSKLGTILEYYRNDINEAGKEGFTLPHICIKMDEKMTASFCTEMVIYASQKHCIQCAGLTDADDFQDCRFFHLRQFENVSIMSVLAYIAKHTDSDMIVSAWSPDVFERESNKLCTDICVFSEKDEIVISSDDRAQRKMALTTTASVIFDEILSFFEAE